MNGSSRFPPPQTPPRRNRLGGGAGTSSKLIPSSYVTPSKYSTPCGGGTGRAVMSTSRRIVTSSRYHLHNNNTNYNTTRRQGAGMVTTPGRRQLQFSQPTGSNTKDINNGSSQKATMVVTPSRNHSQAQQRTPYRRAAATTPSSTYHTPMSCLSKAHSQSSPSSNYDHDHHMDDDRFIPSRRRLNMDLCRRALLSGSSSTKDLDGDDVDSPTASDRNNGDAAASSSATSPNPHTYQPEETPLQKEYKRRLLSTLCNIPLDQLNKDGEPVRGLLPFGSASGQSGKSSRSRRMPHRSHHSRGTQGRVIEGGDGIENMMPPSSAGNTTMDTNSLNSMVGGGGGGSGIVNVLPPPPPARLLLTNPFEHDTLRQIKMGRTTSGGNHNSHSLNNNIVGCWEDDVFSASYYSSIANRGYTRKVPTSPIRILDAPDIVDDYYLNLISWSADNILAVALAQSVYLWNATNGDIQHLVTVDEVANDYITSVCWCPSSSHSHLIAVGTNMAQVHIFDGHSLQKLFTISPHASSHMGRISALAWNPSQAQWLTSGARDSLICNFDLRQPQQNANNRMGRSTANYVTSHYRGHEQEVCGLKWNEDGTCLASGGNENFLCLWDAQMSQRNQSSSTTTNGSSLQSPFRFSRSRISATTSSSSLDHAPRLILRQHKAAVKALDWCPFHRGLLASGGGTADRTIKFWNSNSGAVLHSVDTGSQVCSVLWSPLSGARELCSSHGYSENQLILWKYPTMTKIQELKGHSARVLNMEKSPDGASVVSAAADETLRFWNVFSTPHDSSVSSLFSTNRSHQANEFLTLGVPTIR